MRSLVQSVQCFTTAFSAALAQAFTPLTADPHLVWNYGSVAVVSFFGGVGFYLTFLKADRNEDRLNNLEQSKYEGRYQGDEETTEVEPAKIVNERPDEKRAI